MQRAPFLTLKQLKAASYGTRERLEQEFKKAGLKSETESYRPVQTEIGSWRIEDIDPDASQEIQMPKPEPAKAKRSAPKDGKKPAADNPPVNVLFRDDAGVVVAGEAADGSVIIHPNTSKATRQPAAVPLAKRPPPAKPKLVKPEPPAKTPAVEKPKAAATATRKLGKSSGPDPEELPKGFDDWLLDMARSKDGVLRNEINKRLGAERRWSNHLTALGKKHGLTLSRSRDGRFTRFYLKKA